MRVALAISAVLVAVGAAATVLIISYGPSLDLDSAELIGIIIQVWLGTAAFVSAALVVTSYIHTNMAFQLSQKPQLLVQIVSQFQVPPDGPEKGQRFPITVLVYKNLSSNQFEDLTLKLKVVCGETTICLDDLFTSDMFMAAGDSRNRRFRTFDELKQRGFDMLAAVKRGEDVFLRPSYTFTFAGRKHEIEIQEYRWDAGRSEWQLR